MNRYSIKIFLYTIAEFLLGGKLVKHLYLKYSIRKFKRASLFYIHIPRTGGTSISKVIFGKRNGHFSALELRENVGMNYFNATYSFAMVRNPFERLVSAYQFIKSEGGKYGAVRTNKAFSSRILENFENFIKLWLVFQPHDSVDLLLRPQYLFVTDENEKLIISKIFKIENLEEFKVEVGSIIGRSINIPRLNFTDHLHFSKYYNEELIELVFNYYKKDFDIFHYSKELPAYISY